MKFFKNTILISLVLFVTAFTMFVPNAVNCVSDYYLTKIETAHKPEISKINILDKEIKKSEVASSLLNSNITEINNIQSDISSKDVVNDILNIFSEIFGKDDAYLIFENMINKSKILFMEPRLSIGIEKGETIMFEIVYAKLDCGLDISYEKESGVVLSFGLFNNFTFQEFNKLRYILEESNIIIAEYYENTLLTKQYYTNIEKFVNSEESFIFNFGLDFSPDKSDYSEIIYNKDAEYWQ